MQMTKEIFAGVLSAVVCCTSALAGDCDNATYRRYNPDKCANYSDKTAFSFAGTGTILTGGAALIGGALAVLSLGGSGGGSSSATDTTPMPTLPTYTYVGGDVKAVELASVMNQHEYERNFNQYNEIRLGYSLARGFTGKNSTIAVIDAGLDTRHGRAVENIASGQIAPDAIVKSYKVADGNDNFLPYSQIGDVIKSARGANIYNFSWSVSKRANSIYSREQITALTDKNFINSLSTAATKDDAIFVWAAGNDGHAQSSALSALPMVMSELKGHFVNVVAYDTGRDTLADFSNACGVTKNYCITAPGTNLDTGDRMMTEGTSFAAPIVSAAVAVIREAFPYMQASEITNLLFTTARDLGTPGVDEVYGHGMLDLERATRPVGAELVPLADNMTVSLNTARVSGTIGTSIKSADIKFAFVDSFGRAFETNMNDNIEIRNRSIGFERLRDNNTRGAQIGNLEFGFKRSDFLTGDGFLSSDSDALISFIGTHNSLKLGSVELFQHTTLGVSAPTPNPESMISGFSNIYTASAHIGARHGDWSFSVGTPDTIIDGTMTMHVPTGRNRFGQYTFRDYSIDLASRPAIEYSASYKSLTAGFVDNPYGTDEFYMIAKTKVLF